MRICVSGGATYVVVLHELCGARQQRGLGGDGHVARDRSASAAVQLPQLPVRATHERDKVQIDGLVGARRGGLPLPSGRGVCTLERVRALQQLGAVRGCRATRHAQQLRERRVGLDRLLGGRVGNRMQQADRATRIANLGQCAATHRLLEPEHVFGALRPRVRGVLGAVARLDVRRERQQAQHRMHRLRHHCEQLLV